MENDEPKMEAQYAEVKGELLLELREKMTTLTVRDFTPAGARLEQNLQGEVTGRYNAKHSETNSLLVRPDGSFEYEGKGIETTSDGEIVLLTAKGSGGLDAYPMVKFNGEGSCQTPSKKLSWLNTIKIRFEGTYNLDSAELTSRIYAKK
jgi:hypothetical protein